MTHANFISSKHLPGFFGVSCLVKYMGLMSLSLVLFVLASTGVAQQPIQVVDDSQDKVYRELAREAESMIRQHSLLKKIVKAAGPGSVALS